MVHTLLGDQQGGGFYVDLVHSLSPLSALVFGSNQGIGGPTNAASSHSPHPPPSPIMEAIHIVNT